MKKILSVLLCFLSFEMQALEYNIQFENEQISIVKAKISPYEETSPYSDIYPQVVIALKGGTITRLEADGRVTEVIFPTGTAVFLKVDTEKEPHRSINNSSEPVELILIELKNSLPIDTKADENSHEIKMELRINCPMSPELRDFIKSIPPIRNYSSTFAEWKSSFINNMNQLIHLVESEKIYKSFWSVVTTVKTEDVLSQETTGN